MRKLLLLGLTRWVGDVPSPISGTRSRAAIYDKADVLARELDIETL